MAVFDVCNGDADGLCAALQWRRSDPRPALLLTGLKREIELLGQVQAGPGDEVNVFDLSLARNLAALERLLARGVPVRYFDHHVAEVPEHPLLDAVIDPRPDTCTSLLVDRQLGGAARAWALVGAYGDNLGPVADRLAQASGFDLAATDALRRLGETLNYNAYGEDESDVCIAPARLYALMAGYADPLEMWREEPVVAEIAALRQADLAQAWSASRHWWNGGGSIHVLPDERWARRVLGTYANELDRADPSCGHAVLREQPGCAYALSLRAPRGAHQLCRRFGGGGRAGAAGVDHLPGWRFSEFVDAFGAGPWTTWAPPARAEG